MLRIPLTCHPSTIRLPLKGSATTVLARNVCVRLNPHGPSSYWASYGLVDAVPPSPPKLPELRSLHLDSVYESCACTPPENRRLRLVCSEWEVDVAKEVPV